MHRAQTCENGSPNSSEAGLRTVCNSVEILKKRDKFSKRLLEKVKNKEDLSQMEYSTEKEILQPILEHGMEGMSEVLQKLFNFAMKLERENALKASPYQRTAGRTGYANGFKERHIQSRVGELELQIPQTRNVEFYPSCLERGLRSERAINLAMAEMYIQLLHLIQIFRRL